MSARGTSRGQATDSCGCIEHQGALERNKKYRDEQISQMEIAGERKGGLSRCVRKNKNPQKHLLEYYNLGLFPLLHPRILINVNPPQSEKCWITTFG